MRVLFLCTGNSARSQIAEALLATKGKGRFTVASAGTRIAARVNPGAVEVLREHGVDWTDHSPKLVDDFVGQPWDVVITVCDNAKESCPIFPGAPVQAHWGMPDPAEVEGEVEKRRAFRDAYDVLDRRIGRLLALPLEHLDREALRQRFQEIGNRP